MDRMLLLAGVLLLLLSAAHSALGERLVFARLHKGGQWSDEALRLMALRRWWSVRATWHLVSILGVGLAALLLSRALGGPGPEVWLGATFLVAMAYWAAATRLGHPAWIVMGVIGGILLIPN